MNLRERQIFEIQPDFLGISRHEIRSQRFGFVFAEGAFEIAEQHQYDGSARRAQAWLQLGVQLLELWFEWILVDVEETALDDLLAVFGDVKALVHAGRTRRSVHLHFVKTG